MKKNPIVSMVIMGLISLGAISLVGSFILAFYGKAVPDGLGVGVTAGVVGALSAILSRTGHDAAGTVADPVVTTVSNHASDPIPVTSADE